MSKNQDDQESPVASYLYNGPLFLSDLHDRHRLLQTAIATKRSVDSIEISVNETSFSEYPEDANDFFARIGALVGLQSLRLLPEHIFSMVQIQIPLLTTVLQHATSLTSLAIGAADLQANQDEYSQFLAALSNHPSLKIFRAIRCNFPENTSYLNQLIDCVSQLASLKELEISAAELDTLGTLSNESMHQLSHSPFLQKICLQTFEFSENQILSFFRALEMNQCLQSLTVSAAGGVNMDCLHDLSHLIRANTTLEEISLSFDFEGEYKDELLVEIAQALQTSPLTHFTLSGLPKQSQTTQLAFLDMIKRNYILENFSLLERTDMERDIDFYLALNRMGRSRIMRDLATRQDFLEVMLKSKQHLACLYYFISANPQAFLDILRV